VKDEATTAQKLKNEKAKVGNLPCKKNVQMFIDQCFDIMPHQMKGIGNGL
jgi:hypothetical protein